MSDKSAAQHAASVPTRKLAPSSERDTLPIDQLFLRDQLEALLVSPTLTRTSAPPSQDGTPAELDSGVYERDTEPGIDVQLLRKMLNAGLK